MRHLSIWTRICWVTCTDHQSAICPVTGYFLHCVLWPYLKAMHLCQPKDDYIEEIKTFSSGGLDIMHSTENLKDHKSSLFSDIKLQTNKWKADKSHLPRWLKGDQLCRYEINNKSTFSFPSLESGMLCRIYKGMYRIFDLQGFTSYLATACGLC